MNLSNKYGGLVIGTGDLSELALGWATYNGDHMSMYAVNVSIPKTLVRYLTAYEAEISDGELKTVLLDVLDTPVSPELLPPDKNGEIAQKTEDVVGPYELHDFFLYYFVRFGFTPSKIYYLAKHSFAGKYNNDTIKKWLVTFLKRFFSVFELVTLENCRWQGWLLYPSDKRSAQSIAFPSFSNLIRLFKV